MILNVQDAAGTSLTREKKESQQKRRQTSNLLPKSNSSKFFSTSAGALSGRFSRDVHW
jgi:hypothetical protein